MLYPPKDICSVSVPNDGRGCGQTHTRPAGADGLPVHPWPMSCAGGCEEYLASTDSRFVRTVHEIPLTYDEQKEVEHLKERGSADRDQIMLAALAKIAGLPLPDSVARGLPAAAPVTALLACPSCSSAQASGNAFCGSCGSPMRVAAPAPAITGSVS